VDKLRCAINLCNSFPFEEEAEADK